MQMSQRHIPGESRRPDPDGPLLSARRTLRLIALVALAVFLLDQLTKWLVVEAMDLANRQEIRVVDPFLNFTMAWNTGINFGLFGADDAGLQRWVLVGLALAISGALAWWAVRRGEWWLALGAGIVMGGAVGNAWDRVRYGAVADFLNMSCCGIDNPYAFNVADVAIFAGAVLIALKA
ncbi:MAG TPA: signal peptidase II [Thermohalobaculum sp.]|nr:signal peptidase II [Thermohalobaculum sp.]